MSFRQSLSAQPWRWSLGIAPWNFACVFIVLVTICPGLPGFVASAHEVRPAYLGLEEIEHNDHGSTFDVTWKQPLLNDKRLRMNPLLPRACEHTSAHIDDVIPGALIRSWRVVCSPDAFQQEPLRIQGLSRTLTDVWVTVRLLSGEQTSAVLTPTQPRLWLNQSRGTHLISYLSLGVEHLLFGFDHILFVMGLMFFVSGFASLAKTVTAFTIAHSITLAASSLNIVHLSQAPVEAAIALSILFLAVEASLADRRQCLTARLPWLIAFTFGLLHGFGFAGALKAIGLPDDTAVLALLLFNLGVEIGQILVISVILGGLALLAPRTRNLPAWLAHVPLYVMGSMASFWFFVRVSALIW